MKKIAVFTVLALICFSMFAQENTSNKIKIALLGTVHLTPSSVDMYANKGLAISSEKRQKEVKNLIDKIAAFHPDQICVEYPLERQRSLDSLYNKFLNGEYKLQNDEIDQIGLNAAKRLNLEKLTCVNHYGKFDSDTVMKYAQENGQLNIAEEMGKYGETFIGEINTQLEEESILDFLIYLNSKKILNKNAEFYTKYFASIGKEEDYVGTELVSDWYDTNLHIYTNIIRQIKPTDKTILVIFGQGHIPILKHLFDTNSDFEVIEVEEILK